MTYTYRHLLLATLIAIMPLQSAAAVEVPHKIAGIELGTSVEAYPDFEFSNFLKEIVVMDWHGFRKGVISYGICHSPGVIVRLQMKYEDSSKEFFDTLFKRYKQKFGTPSIWKGDSFGIKHIWKWQFVDDQGRQVNMILQHNLQDENASIGNQVKLYLPELMEEEHLCFLRECEEAENSEALRRKQELKKSGWEYLIPQ